MDMEILSVRNYRNNLAASFARAEKGEEVLIRRKNQIYALVSVGTEDVTITPRLQKQIDEARKAYSEGQCASVNSKADLASFLED